MKYTQLSPNGESGTYSLFGEDVDDGYDASGRKRATKLPPGFQLTARRRDEAYRLGVTDPELEWGAFVDFHTARGSTYLSWPAAWRMWCRNTHRFGQQQRARPSGRTAEQEWAELMRRERESSQSQRDDQ